MNAERYDWNAIVGGLNRFLRLRSIPIGMKLFETVEAAPLKSRRSSVSFSASLAPGCPVGPQGRRCESAATPSL